MSRWSLWLAAALLVGPVTGFLLARSAFAFYQDRRTAGALWALGAVLWASALYLLTFWLCKAWWCR